ncbi:5608_t:CDS:2, partial [Entrophospora sp. SA101]
MMLDRFLKSGSNREEKTKGHYSASCKYCPKTWNCGTPFKLKAHLANECPSCHYSISHFYLDGINQQSSKIVKKQNAQTPLSKFYESAVLTDQRKYSINKSLLLAFICC